MSMFVERIATWRQWAGLMFAMVAAAIALVAAGKMREREAEPRVRTVDADAAMRVSRIQTELARTASLWLDGRVFECRIATQYYRMDRAEFIAVANMAGEIGVQPWLAAPAMAADVTVTRTSTYIDPFAVAA
jgi:hypothetical protein